MTNSLLTERVWFAGIGPRIFRTPTTSQTRPALNSSSFNVRSKHAGTNAVSPGGTVIIKTAGSSSEIMTISKPMTIRASDGAATVGHHC
jgi:hypothetical protein